MAQQPLSYLFPQRIAIKLTLVISVLMIILLSMLGMTLTRITENIAKENIKISHEEIAALAADQVSVFMKRPIELLNTASQLIGRVHTSPWDQETVLVEMSLNFPMFEEILSFNSEGHVIASSNPGEPVKNSDNQKLFQKVMLRGRQWLSNIYVSKDHLPHMTIAVPYKNRGKIAGILIAQVNMRGIWNIADDIHIGKTGRALLVAQDGLLVAHPDKRLVLQNKNLSTYPDFQKMISGKIGSAQYRLNGKVFFTSYAPIRGPAPLFVMIEREGKEAYEMINQLDLFIWLVLFISLSLSIAISFFVAKWLVRPIQSLQEWSKKVALGDFDYCSPPQSLDEIGRLFLRFKRMSIRLKIAREKEHYVAMGMMATRLSHKLKNSIVFLKTFAQLFPERKNDARFVEKFEREFPSSIDALERIFRNLSQVASANEMKKEPLNLAALFQSLQHIYMDMMAKLKIDFQMELGPKIPEMLGDREQLQELFVNLILNAIHAMPCGGTLTLRAAYERKSDEIKITLSDTGVGIAPQNVQQVFKPFFTTKPAGMGLGLAISKEIVEKHGGTISVSSEQENGTIFTIKFWLQKRIRIETPDISPEPKLSFTSS